MLPCLFPAPAVADNTQLSIDVANPTHAISPVLYGAFFEEINLAGEGGLYGELVRNRSFGNSTSPDYWSTVMQGTSGWLVNSGTWGIDTGVTPSAYSQSANGQNYGSTLSLPGSETWTNYTLTLQARKLSGSEGFLVLFNMADANNWCWWNIGGWTNTYHAVEQTINGVKTTGPRVAGSITTNQWYNIKIVIQGKTVSCYLDNVLVQTFTASTAGSGGIGLSTWNTQAEFRNIVVTSQDSQILYQSDFSAANSFAGQMSVDTTKPLNATNLQSLKLVMNSSTGTFGAGNAGFWGIPLQAGSTYDLSLYACGDTGYTGPINVRLENATGSILYSQTSFSGLTTDWQRFTASFTPTVTDTTARIVVSISQPGTVWLDEVSLFPHATFLNRPNGMRADVANMVAAMKPKFMRFPGGNYIEGTTLDTAVRWKTTIGDVATRPGHWNSAWNYNSTDGLGFHEFLQLCEDLGAEPLFGINCGLSLSYNGSATNTVPLAQMGPWVQDALDAIEYANGDVSTTWGAKRAANGHPAPFNLKYMEIGNENGGTYYNDRFALFYDAIKAVHPEIQLVSCVWGGRETSRPLEIIDEHYYSDSATFRSYATKYDSYSRTGPKVFVGEYAVTSGSGYGNLDAALGEAAFMTGMERNSDIVVMASYAPLLENVNLINWHPNAICYDNSRVYGTPSYHVQKMFSTNVGTKVLPMSITYPTSSYHGKVGLSTWNTQAGFSNVTVTDANSQVLYQSDFAGTGTTGWTFTKGTWAVSGTELRQTANDQDDRGTVGDTAWSNYTYTLKARKISGNEGFLIMFNVVDSNNWVWWNVGGWSNTKHGIEQCVNGTKTTIAQVTGSVTTGTTYDIKIQVSGKNVSCYLNNTLTQTVTLPDNNVVNPIYAVASLNPPTHEVIIKAVNPNSTALATTMSLTGLPSIAASAQSTVLTSANLTDENTLAAPNTVAPTTSTISTPAPQFDITLPPYSVTALRVQAPVAQPQGLAVSTATGTARLTWNATSGASSYTVSRATSSTGPWQVIATSLSDTNYTDATVQTNVVYFYSITGVNAAGTSTDSTHLVTMPLPPSAGIQPQGADFVVSVPSLTGVSYQLQQSNTLTASDWSNVGDSLAGTGQTLQTTAQGAIQNGTRFFRFKLTLPTP